MYVESLKHEIDGDVAFERAKIAMSEMLGDAGYDEGVIEPNVVNLIEREFKFTSENHCYLCLSQDTAIKTGIQFADGLKIVCPMCKKRLGKKKEGDADEVAGCDKEGCAGCVAFKVAVPAPPNTKNKTDKADHRKEGKKDRK